MSMNHGINAVKNYTSYYLMLPVLVSIPIFIGCWPCHKAGGYTGKPQIARSFEEAEELGGYSNEWRDLNGAPKWNLCQAAYGRFRVSGITPAIFLNVFDPATHKKAVAASTKTVSDHAIKLSGDVINDPALIVKSDENTLAKGTDYEVSYVGENCVIELISTSTYYAETSLSVAYNEADLSGITPATIEMALEKIEDCKALLGTVPDMIIAPGWSQTPAVAAVMATKAANINGIFKGKAIVDLDTSASGADSYDDVAAYKAAQGYADENMIVCWPLVKIGDKLFDYSVILSGKMAQIDNDNGGVPFESPSNKEIGITACVNKAGNEINLSVQQADVVSYSAGVVTALNFNGWRVWGNYTGVWPGSDDVAKHFIPTSRMMDYLCNTFVEEYWEYVDRPLTRVLIDAIVDSYNSYLAALTHDGMLVGGEIVFVEENNPTSDLIAGKFRLDVRAASPTPAQRIDLYAEFDVDMLTAAYN